MSVSNVVQLHQPKLSLCEHVLAARLLWHSCRATKGQPWEPHAPGDRHCQSPGSLWTLGWQTAISSSVYDWTWTPTPRIKCAFCPEVCHSFLQCQPCPRDALALQSLPDTTHAKVQLFSQCACLHLHLHTLQLPGVLRLPSPSKSFIS